jgi:flagellar hook-associated protein 2
MSSTIDTTTRITGIASGLDTEELVEKLTEVYQLRIDAAEQQKQLLEWKQEAYLEITSALIDFQTKYFSNSGTGLSISKSLSSMSAGSFSSPYLTVSTSSSSAASNVYVSDIVSLATGAKVTGSQTATAAPTLQVNADTLSELGCKSLKITLDGVEKTITFGAEDYASAEDVTAALQSLADAAFGSGRVTVARDGDSITLDAGTSTLSIAGSGVEGSDAAEVLTFTEGASNRLNLTSSLSASGLAVDPGETVEFSINGVSFSFTSESTLSQIIQAVNKSAAGVTLSYSTLTDKFTLSATETGSGSQISFSDSQGSFMGAILGEGVTTAGTDAVVKLSTDGSTDESSMITITRSTNSFEIDGTTYTLTGKASGDTEENLSITVGTDVDAMVETITQFVEDYNSLLAKITDKLSETKYSDYLPLTDSEREELSETQQEQWTEKAKSGILLNDSVLQNLASQLRRCLFSDILETGTEESIGVYLASIGITTGTYSEKGQLKIDETALRSALQTDASDVIDLFTQKSSISYSQYASDEQKTTRYSESGLFERLSDIIKNSVSKTGVKGTLIELAGASSSSESIYKTRIDKKEEEIEKLTQKLEDAQDRYWSQFTAMETALSKLNSQSAWLSQMLSGSNS